MQLTVHDVRSPSDDTSTLNPTPQLISDDTDDYLVLRLPLPPISPSDHTSTLNPTPELISDDTDDDYPVLRLPLPPICPLTHSVALTRRHTMGFRSLTHSLTLSLMGVSAALDRSLDCACTWTYACMHRRCAEHKP